MRRVSAFVGILGGMSIGICALAADPPAYNKTDTFQPGKKYTCVPTSDRKNWDCNEAGKSAQSAPASAPIALPAPPAEAKAVAPPASVPSRSSTLPSYLTSAAAENSAPPTPPPSTVSAAADHASARPAESFGTSRPPPPQKAASVAATPKAASRSAPVAAKSAKPAPAARAVDETKSHRVPAANGGFLDLPGDRFVIELAHASSPSTLAESRSAIHVPRGEVYELHLRQNGTDTWLLLWGTFDGVDAARTARSELAQSTSAALGFPRRVAPLQAEARRASP